MWRQTTTCLCFPRGTSRTSLSKVPDDSVNVDGSETADVRQRRGDVIESGWQDITNGDIHSIRRAEGVMGYDDLEGNRGTPASPVLCEADLVVFRSGSTIRTAGAVVVTSPLE